MSQRPLTAVILAAGLGTRLRSSKPKVLHAVGGKPMLDLVVDACRRAGVKRVIVVLNPAQPEVAEHLGRRAEVVYQKLPNGTGHALAQVPAKNLDGDVLVVNADAALVRPETIKALVARHRRARARVTIGSTHDASRRDGRVIRDAKGEFVRIVEDKDATAAQRRIDEINVGVYCFRSEDLQPALARLEPKNKAGELYLTDAVGTLNHVEVFEIADSEEALGINDRVELARAEKVIRLRKLQELMLSGVTIRDPDSTWVSAEAKVGRDTVIEPFTFIQGATRIGEGCSIGPHTDIADSQIGAGCRVERSWLRQVKLGDRSDCGPFVRIRPGTVIAEDVHIGSFAEINRSRIGAGSAVPHFSYLGDSVIGRNVNIGAGTVTANYDGVRKNRTEIGDGAFVGVDTLLRAPVRLGKGSKTGAGSVVLEDVPPGVTVAGAPARQIRRKA
ncbi:MAG: UDP-N-acetylglucosamine diphosphorylase/glucosamine-1-phosphate N-acetyltransferase [Chloroflexi bacterium]|nr:MAG: UDP-N-acetylglucosamine diphosphorylase/glucosamine-1-phosphate N-acetyltransferase [Chloroflexota bacterium]